MDTTLTADFIIAKGDFSSSFDSTSMSLSKKKDRVPSNEMIAILGYLLRKSVKF